MNPAIAQLGQLALAGRPLDREQARRLAHVRDDERYDLFYWANAVRLKHFGRSVTLCSIAPGRLGGCSEDCRFCAQSARYHTHIQPGSRTPAGQLVESARQARAAGAGHFGVVNSGRGPTQGDLDELAEGCRLIAADPGPPTGQGGAGPLTVCASLGRLSADQAARLAGMGVRRYNHNIETSRRFFGNIVTTHSFDDRLDTLRVARDAGLELCCGGIFNLGETWDDRIDVAMTLRELAPAMVPLNFLAPIPGTPLADRPPIEPLELLAVVALFRLLLPATPIKLAGGREANLRDLQSWMFYCGATSCMVGNYLTTCGRPAADDLRMLADLGLAATDDS